jgi:hypothetical protein
MCRKYNTKDKFGFCIPKVSEKAGYKLIQSDMSALIKAGRCEIILPKDPTLIPKKMLRCISSTLSRNLCNFLIIPEIIW